MLKHVVAWAVVLLAVGAGVGVRGGEGPLVVLDKGTYWRYAIAWKTETVRRKTGVLEAVPAGRKTPKVTVYGRPPSNWTAVDFDDRSWGRSRGALGTSSAMWLACLRGKFTVVDPAKATGLRLLASFIGGAVIYVNGQELVRQGLAKGELAADAEAEPLPKEAFIDPDGDLYRNGWGDPQRHKERLRARVRTVGAVEIPTRLLRKGVNVIAVEVRRAPADELLLTAKAKGWKAERWRGRGYYWWSRLRFDGLTLTAPAGSTAVLANRSRPDGLQVWNHPIVRRVYLSDYGDGTERLRPVRLVGARNGVLSGQVVVGSGSGVKGLRALASELKGTAGVIPSSSVELCFLRADGDHRGSFGSLAARPPAKPPTVQPVWIRVRVPKDAKAGEYSGRVTLTAEGSRPVAVPLRVRVYGWALPAPQQFTSHVGLIQSPETLAMYYKVPMWSDEHWKLIGRSFELLGQVGCKVIHIPIIRRTHFGNEHSRVRWVSDGKGGYTYDYGLVEKYLDTAVKHLGKVPVVCFYCWEMYTGGSYLGHKARAGKGMLFTVLDPKTGVLSGAEGPKWGDARVRAFWTPVMDGLHAVLKARGLEGSFMLGIAGDTRPTKAAGQDLKAAAPTAKFVVQSHATASNIWGIPVGYLADVWAAPSAPDPSQKRLYGWRSSFRRTTFPRAGSNTVGAMRPSTPLAMWYVSLEAMQTAGIHGFGRMGADFWPVIKSPRRRGYRHLFGRFPESGWAQLNAQNSSHFVLAPGQAGALSTVRFEMIRCAQQVAEARIFIERALTDPAKKAKLGGDLAARCQALLDERVRANNYAKGGWHWFLSSGWQAREEALYALAAEVCAALGGG